MKTKELDDFLNEIKGAHLCKEYKQYNDEIQKMIENLFKATFRLNLYNAQIVFILDEALKPFKKGGK